MGGDARSFRDEDEADDDDDDDVEAPTGRPRLSGSTGSRPGPAIRAAQKAAAVAAADTAQEWIRR